MNKEIKIRFSKSICLALGIALVGIFYFPQQSFALQNVSSDSAESIPLNSDEELPSRIAENISDDSQLISSELAVSRAGVVRNVETGEEVVNEQWFGTPDTQPDPLAKTNGKSFIPVPIKEVRESIDNAPAAVENSRFARSTGRQAEVQYPPIANVKSALPNSEWGPYWGTHNGTPAFFQKNGALFAQQAKGVIDVSEWQKDIDWNAVKNSGVEGAIIRIGFGWGSENIDKKALYNIRELKRLGIPFGVYLYSYAYNGAVAGEEGNNTVELLRKAGVSPGDLAYPVYYDLENWTWSGHTPPSTPQQYEEIVKNWWQKLEAAGYHNLSVYSAPFYLDDQLNSPYIHNKTHWVATYGPRTLFKYPANYRGWQYSSLGRIAGIEGNVDLNAFGNLEFFEDLRLTWIIRDEHIDVGAVLENYPANNVEYIWKQYDVARNEWKTIQDWNIGNWASWKTDAGIYWLHAQARDKNTGRILGTRTIAFNYSAGITSINGTYIGRSGDGFLLGASASGAHPQYKVLIYDYLRKQWVQSFSGQWAMWYPQSGIYWVRFEVRTSDGRLAEARTFPVGV